ncbi:glycosyltransferase involved in cell wall biosynthesis [Sediminihabitans luteus]|uniref:Glycosyltransferase involved in cell wall biosynthesis n=1 Tax=Sediminihabitans luteus TaxID=1138585 RepID=A0A2M9CE79_9CELL|nr:hypothetical protein [Sediminihabitans luteus]PJJ70165.1 glycosyltransferase involved in cell wall biosynthesis [Sediminihabitans luteus]GII97636.1 hypothetical protein Slu03_00140 [Sediminihabitans luteus]
MRVVVFSNDVVPGMAMPVAAPGLRAWGLAQGLRAHGHDVTLVVDDRVVARVWRRGVPPATPRGTVVLSPQDLQTYANAHRADALVVTNSNPVRWLDDGLRARLVYDFFAPKVLEFEEKMPTLPPSVARRQREGLVRQKIDGLRRCDAVVVNGAKKLPYVQSWLERAGVPGTPTALATMALPLHPPRRRTEGPVELVVSGYLQPWSRPGAWVEAVLPLLDAGTARLHLMVAHHWGATEVGALPDSLARLAAHPATTQHGTMDFREFRGLLAGCDVSIDVFARNPERELAMVTRSVVALSCGVPVMHVPFTEVSPMIEAYGAGWLVDEDDVEAVGSALGAVVRDRGELVRRQDGAQALAQDLVDAREATRAMSSLLEEVCR